MLRRSVIGMSLFAALALAACGGDSGTTTTTTTEPSTTTTSTPPTTVPPVVTTTTAPGPPNCHTSQMSAAFVNPDAGAGQRHLTLVLTNNGSASCEVFGYVGLQLLTSGGTVVPTNVTRINLSARAHVLVPAGGQVSTLMHWAVIPGPGEPQSGQCEPTPGKIEITPPNETDFLTQPWTNDVVCEHGSIDVTPLVLGVPSP